MKRVFIVVLCLAFLITVALPASAISTTPMKPLKSSTAAPITFTYFQQSINGTQAGIQKTPVAEELKRITGVTLNVIIGDADKFKILAAGGDLPDIISVVGQNSDVQSLVAAKQIIPLNSLMDKYGQNIKKRIPIALNVDKDTYGGGKDLYIFNAMTMQQDRSNPAYNGNIGFFPRYDLYKAVGSPAMKTEDDFLNTLKKMVAYKPVAKDGKKVYALSGWTDSGLWPYTNPYPYSYGYYYSDGIEALNLATGQFENNYSDPNSIFWRSVKFYNKAYQMGIMDPEAFTMKMTQYTDKVKNGEVICSVQSTMTTLDPAMCGDTARMYQIPGPFPVYYGLYPSESPFGWNQWWGKCITSNCKDPARAMQFLNFCNSDEGSRLILSGVQGKQWNYVNGKPQLIGDALKSVKGDKSISATYQQDMGINQLQALTVGYWTCSDGASNNLFDTMDVKIAQAQPADKEFAQKYGGKNAVFPGQAYNALVKSGKYKSYSAIPIFSNMINMTESFNRIWNDCDAYLVANIGRIILSKTDAAFNQAKSKAISDMKAKGMTKYEQQFVKDLETAKAKAKKYAGN